jgi:hypothetical protein
MSAFSAAQTEKEKAVRIGTPKVLTARGRILLTAGKIYFVLRKM